MSQNWIDGLYVLVALGFMLMGGVLGYWLGKENGARDAANRYRRAQRLQRQRDFSGRG